MKARSVSLDYWNGLTERERAIFGKLAEKSFGTITEIKRVITVARKFFNGFTDIDVQGGLTNIYYIYGKSGQPMGAFDKTTGWGITEHIYRYIDGKYVATGHNFSGKLKENN